VRYFVEIHELQTELSAFEARGVANFGTQCIIGCFESIHFKQTLTYYRRKSVYIITNTMTLKNLVNHIVKILQNFSQKDAK